jgi:serine/threonine-protein kinase
MVAQTNECNRQRLELLLADQLSKAEQAAAARHLESCQTCRRHLEQFAGDERWWGEASDFLRPRADDLARGDGSSADASLSSAQLLSTDELGPVEFSLDFLESSDNPAMIGRLGEYEILELIGRGGMGVVLKGYQRELNRYVAVKVMAPHYASSGAARKRFAREAQAAAAVVHPHVVAIHSVDAKAKLPYLVMPYVAAKSLQARIDQDGPLEVKEILRIGKQAAEGLAAAHAQGLVHRDIKPANILLEDDVGRVLLTDFGLARAVDDATMTRSGVIAGTPQYMSPEQAHGEAIDHRADLFSLGSVLYAMCAGHPAFRAETTMGILRRICEETPRPVCEVNCDVPAWLGRIIERLHAKDPAERFQSAAEVAELLGKCLAHVQQPTAVPLPKSLCDPRTTKRTSHRWPRVAAWIGSIAVACLVVVVAIVLSIGSRSVEDDKNSQQPSADVSSPKDNGTPPVDSDFPSAVWNDGSVERILELDHDSAQLERRAEQLWDDTEIASGTDNDNRINDLREKETGR